MPQKAFNNGSGILGAFSPVKNALARVRDERYEMISNAIVMKP
jgi:hypothetical protein